MFEIIIDQDELAAWIVFTSDHEVPCEKIEEGLKEAGVVFGIDTFLIQDIAKAHQSRIRYQIAQSLSPQGGLKYFFSQNHGHQPKRLTDGRVDFYNLDAIQSVVKGQPLVSKVQVEKRKSGKTVTGIDIPPCTLNVPLPTPGANVGVSDDGLSLIALTNGYPVLIGSTLYVDVSYTLDGDVDFSSGNIACIGDLLITGDIKSGFHVECAQNVTVFGIIDGGGVEAGGNILLHGNVFGQHKSLIKSGKSVRGVYVDATIIESQDDLILTNGARRSSMKSMGSIEVQGAGGFIIGGITQAAKRIVTHDLGCEKEIPTRVEVLPGLYDAITIQRFLNQLDEMVQMDQRLINTQCHSKRQSKQAVEMKKAVEQSRTALSHLIRYFATNRWMLGHDHWPSRSVIVTGTAYPGVVVGMDNADYVVSQPITNVMFYLADGIIRTRTLEQ